MVEVDVDSLSPGDLVNLIITVTPVSEGVLTNTVDAVCNALEPDLDNNTAVNLTRVLTPVTITNQPTSLIVSASDAASFSVGVSGTPPILYQWAFNGVNLSGATDASLTFTNVSLSQAGSYTVIVSQVPGPRVSYRVQSDAAALDVLP